MKESYINLDESDLNKPIYRIFSLKYFCELALTKKNTLVHPSKWDDPLENFLLNQKIQTDRGPARNHSRKNIYGQCWTFKNESDAMWRIYSSKKSGVKVKTTVKKLFNSLQNVCRKTDKKFCYIGKVEYYKREEIQSHIDKFKRTKKYSKNGLLEARKLLLKRETFSYEDEIRLISYFRERYPTSELFKYNVNPKKVFSEIALDPRLKNEKKENMIEKLTSLGFNSKDITQSKLYRLNKNEIRVLS
ncbi:DUF2971 domain-containing protein [Fodinibius halophilus]|uniref:DUF2971 domain-containing protein n=1 Tax=Fodinibius halophilus TaxID=1736908 RepID=A0A6M1T9V7_9BACT|nr:DUF2971 domain-containing protein [Fodinibius halophilus]NGP90285.1 DUF2971 domain-containing protein [Fodinibius halophilus]